MSNRSEGPFSGTGPKGYKRPPESLKEQVCDALAADGYVDASKIQVEVVRGKVTLTGSVPAPEQHRLAEDCVASVLGIRSVENRMSVDRDTDDSGNDGGSEFGTDTTTATRPARTLGNTPDRKNR
jgi:osmotically-inducible protein OsmY